MPSNYWSKVLDNRISRRRGLTVAGAGVMSAAFLAACGGSDSGGNSGNDAKDKASLVTKPEDTVKQAKKGGILKERLLGDAPTMDVQQPISPLNRTARHVYNTLVRPKRNYLDETNFDVEPDFAESWEIVARRPDDHDEAARQRQVAQQGAGQRPRRRRFRRHL